MDKDPSQKNDSAESVDISVISGTTGGVKVSLERKYKKGTKDPILTDHMIVEKLKVGDKSYKIITSNAKDKDRQAFMTKLCKLTKKEIIDAVENSEYLNGMPGIWNMEAYINEL